MNDGVKGMTKLWFQICSCKMVEKNSKRHCTAEEPLCGMVTLLRGWWTVSHALFPNAMEPAVELKATRAAEGFSPALSLVQP